MGRRSYGFSASNIQKIASAYRRRQKNAVVKGMIRDNSSKETERPLEHSLKDVVFNEATRIAKVTIEEKRVYRTIDRYVTNNYVKYPVYSEWKSKYKTINKTVKLTNNQLENLNIHEDELISLFAEDIIVAIGNEDLYPSWLLTTWLKDEFSANLEAIEDEIKYKTSKSNLEIKKVENSISLNKYKISEIENKKTALYKKISKTQLKYNKIKNLKKNMLVNILTLGIYSFLTSEKRKNKIQGKINGLHNDFKNLELIKNTLENELDNFSNNIINLKGELNTFLKVKDEERITLKNQLSTNLSSVEPLLDIHTTDLNEFIPIKKLTGFSSEKVIGCYVIKNIELDKYYVGQSKDIYKRLKQHFNHTTPKNIIFAEDYYTSKLADKGDLFVVKIFPLETKDEMDNKERQLIDQYDSKNIGYNKTSGNI